MSNYWTRIASARVTRRRALAGSAGAMFLVACGGSDSDGASQTPKSDLVAEASDTSKDAKRGGTLKLSIATDSGSWDPHVRGAWFGTLGAIIYSRLTVVKVNGGASTTGEIVGDLAESWEFSGDGLTATFKLKPNAHFHNVAPVNGRSVEAQDVVSTWERWRKISATRATIDNEVNADAPVVSMSALDSRTVSIKLAFPAVSVPSLFSASVGQAFHILPREANEGAYDPRRIALGSGPFALSEHVPSSHMHFKRNAGYHHAALPYMDGVEYPIISEYATGLAAFKSGQVYHYAVRPEEIVGVKQDVPVLNMYQSELQLPQATLFFGYKPGDRGMFRDKRLRQAFSMSIDRDLFADTWYNISNYRSQGLPVETAWSTSVPANEFSGWLLEPQGKDFGPNAKYYRRDITEAKKLMSAAGFANGVEYRSTRAGDNYGPEYDRQIEIMEAMAADAGFKPQTNVVNYQNDLIPNYQSVRGDFEGIGWMLRPQSSSDPWDKYAELMFSGSGPNFIGFDPAGKGDHSGDPRIDDLIRKSKTERDANKRQDQFHELQRYEAEQMYAIRPVSGATGFLLAWPAVQNFLYFLGARRSEEVQYYWIDQTKRPLGG